jgi:metal-responsive CopG/Arc/MetJ family transcriptional regulator
MSIYIMGISVDKRSDFAPKVQEVLTKHGQNILARFGIHDDSDDNGLITLNVRGDENYINEFSKELTSIPSVKVNHMTIK